ncbi:MAG: undecaprenyl-phosphate glucose phosphotransferase [Planctomycetota bacterium]
MVKEHSQSVVAVMGVLDLVVTVGAWVVCYAVRFHSGWFAYKEPTPPPLSDLADVIVISLLLMILVFARLRMYMPRRAQSLGREMLDIVRACFVTWTILLVISYFLHSTFISRKLLGMLLFVWPVMLMGYRGTVRMVLRSLRRRGRNIRRVAIVGIGRTAQKLLHELRRMPWTGYDVLYFVSDQRIGGRLMGVPVRGPIDEVEKIVSRSSIDAVFVALPERRRAKLREVIEKLSAVLVDVNVVPDLLSHHLLRREIQTLGWLPVINLTHSPQSGWNAASKRIFDIFGALAALAVFSPVMLAAAVAVKLTSRGSVFYRQRRASLGGREFDIVKFRTMFDGHGGADTWQTDAGRVTPAGRVLRKLSLDELPQLLNVLRGEMSLVGPRPERPEFIRRFQRSVPRYMLRHHVKAGITGWAQVNGFRGQTSLRKRIQYDLDYINNWSLGFDIRILLMTVFRGFLNPQS